MGDSLEKDLLNEIEELTQDEQAQVLDFARSLRARDARGTPGRELLKFAGTISAEDAALMRRAIEEDCERIDHDSW